MSAFLACDWGTTNLRAWVVDDHGRPLREREFPDLGVSRLKPGEAAERFVREVRPALGADDLPAILCGMAGSTLGWAVVPYEPAPVGLDQLAARLMRVEAPGPVVRIVPGVVGEGVAGAPEVMRGEETQALGWLAEDEARANGRWLVCHPGTHAKWIILAGGRLERFVTAMTGELYDVLRKHSVLKAEAGPVDEAAFALGLESAGEGDALSTRLFTVRSRVTAGGLDPGAAGSYLSGVLIGSEVAGAPRLLGVDRTAPIALVGDPKLCALYQTALERRGHPVARHDGDQAALAGLHALHRRAEQGA
jgi:2-dehydro-3-deoxygalactonokinase